MGFTENKNKKILDLQEEVKEATQQVTALQAESAARQTALQKSTERYEQADKDSTTAHNNYKMGQTAAATASTTVEITKHIASNTQSLMEKAQDLADKAYETAQQAVNAATSISELGTHIDKTKSKNKLISDLLVQDAKKSNTDGAKAVNDAIAALNDALAAANIAIHMANTAEGMRAETETVAESLEGKSEQSIVNRLKVLYTNSNTKTQKALETKNDAQKEMDKVTRDLTIQQNKLSTATLALDAANAAVAQS